MGINLSKGSSINLTKVDGSSLKNVFFGVNWGMITTKGGLFGMGKTQESVDLDASCAVFDSNNKNIETVYFGNLRGCNNAIKHSGDDRSGDSSKDDSDNEVISVDLSSLPASAKTLVFFLNSYKGHKFDKIPYSRIRVLDESKVSLAEYNLSGTPEFNNVSSVILAKVVKIGDSWKFTALGEPSKESKIDGTINEIKRTILI